MTVTRTTDDLQAACRTLAEPAGMAAAEDRVRAALRTETPGRRAARHSWGIAGAVAAVAATAAVALVATQSDHPRSAPAGNPPTHAVKTTRPAAVSPAPVRTSRDAVAHLRTLLPQARISVVSYTQAGATIGGLLRYDDGHGVVQMILAISRPGHDPSLPAAKQAKAYCSISPCAPGADGSRVAVLDSPTPGGGEERMAVVDRRDGLEVTVTVLDATSKTAAPDRPAPPLTRAQLLAVAADTGWDGH